MRRHYPISVEDLMTKAVVPVASVDVESGRLLPRSAYWGTLSDWYSPTSSSGDQQRNEIPSQTWPCNSTQNRVAPVSRRRLDAVQSMWF